MPTVTKADKALAETLALLVRNSIEFNHPHERVTVNIKDRGHFLKAIATYRAEQAAPLQVALDAAIRDAKYWEQKHSEARFTNSRLVSAANAAKPVGGKGA